MKRFYAVPTAGAAAVMLLALTVGCSSSTSSTTGASTSTTGGSTAGSASGKSYKLSFIQGVAGDGFYVTMGCGMQAEAAKMGNVTVNIQGPAQFDATLQNLRKTLRHGYSSVAGLVMDSLASPLK
jgi:ribose transport system substrate-binding protein